MFDLPLGVSFKKERLSFGWAYAFRHTELGELGRILLQDRPDGRTHVTCEVVGDPNDPMTAQRAAIFEPLGMELTRLLDAATGGTAPKVYPLGAATPPPKPPEPLTGIESKMMQCEKCDAGVALLIFADEATDRGGLEDYARLMYPKVKEMNLPTWVIGPTDEPSPESPADILKIWPAREPVQRLRPDEFNPIIDALAEAHCQ